MTRLNFSLFAGSSCAALISAAAAFADVVQVDDLIVQGGLCVGFDCVEGEVFDFVSIKIKENNARLLFEDTSTSSAFPGNDWQLTANASANGGGNYFAIEDVTGTKTPFLVEAGARTNALYVASSSRIGVGTASPSVLMHAVDGNSPTLRLDQDGSSGFNPQVWDLAGNETSFFIRDVTNDGQLPFRVMTGASSDALYVDTDNDIGMGLARPSTPLHIKRATGALQDMVKLENNGDVTMIFSNTNGAAATPEWKLASFNGDFFIGTPTTPGPEFLLSNTGDLTITGKFISGGTTLAVPDYVFEDDYDLMTLAEVREFIDANGHLPRIPSAGEINAGGINLSDMQMSLLEKIEELTLYTLEQKDALTGQADRIAALESELARLAAR